MLRYFIINLLLAESHSYFFDNIKTNGQANSGCNSWFTNCDKKDEERYGFIRNPVCYFTDCDVKRQNQLNPLYWFANNEETEEGNLWLTDQQLLNWITDKINAVKGWFKEYKPEDQIKKEPNHEDVSVNTYFKPDWSLSCWFSECCIEDSIPMDVKSEYIFLGIIIA